VSRAASGNVSNAFILDESCGFFCLLEKGISIDSFNKNYSLVPDVRLPLMYEQKNTLNELMTQLVAINGTTGWLRSVSSSMTAAITAVGNCTERRYNYPQEHEYYLCFNGGFPSKYFCYLPTPSDFSRFFFYVKTFNPYMEICKSKSIILINHIAGIPFKQIYLANLQMHLTVSPFELNEYFQNYTKYYTIFGGQCNSKIIDNIEFRKINKLLYGIYYMKNRINSVDNIQLYPFSVDNYATYLCKNRALKNCPKTVPVRTLFAVDPHCTQDGYLLHRDWGCNTLSHTDKSVQFVFLRRHNITLQYSTQDRIFLNDKVTNTYICNSITGDREYAFVYLGEIQTSNSKLKILKNQKISTFVINHGNNNYSHYMYIILSSVQYLKALRHVVSMVAYICKDAFANNMWSFTIECIFQTINGNFEGQKFCNYSAQKGIANSYLDVHKRYAQYKPDLIASASTLFSRAPIAQIKELLQHRLTNSQTNKPDALFGVCDMGILRNTSAEHRNVSMMRCDNLTLNMLQLNGAELAIYNILQNTLDRHNKYKILPEENLALLQLLLLCNKNIEFDFEHGGKRDLYTSSLSHRPTTKTRPL